MNYNTMHQQLSDHMRLLDLELLHNLAVEAEIIPADKFSGTRYQQMESEDLFPEVLKAIIKDRYQGTDVVLRSHKNQEGMSFSIKSPRIEELLDFALINRHIRFQEETDDTRAFADLVNKALNYNFTYFHRNSTFQRKENRVVFYFTFNNARNLYQNQNTDFLFFKAIFEMFEYVDFLINTDISRFQSIVNAENEARLQREEQQRLQREAELRAYREQQERERRELEERNARSQEEYERRQALLNQGATEGGIDIANQLLEFLGRR